LLDVVVLADVEDVELEEEMSALAPNDPDKRVVTYVLSPVDQIGYC
jgi:hypothetical protein